MSDALTKQSPDSCHGTDAAAGGRAAGALPGRAARTGAVDGRTIRWRSTDIAIALLELLIGRNGRVSAATACVRLGVPRSSLYRVIAALGSNGLLDLSTRGTIALARGAVALAGARDDVLRQADERRRALRAPGPERAAGRYALTRHDEATEIIPSSRPPARLPVRIGFANAALNGPWRVALVHNVEYGATRYRDAVRSLAVRHADDDEARQAEDIMNLVHAGADGLIVSAAPGNAVSAAIAEAARRGVPSVLVDRRPSGDNGLSPFVTCDDWTIGHRTALWMAEYVGGRGRVVLLSGLAGAGPAEQRLAGARAALAAFPDIDVIGTYWTGWQPHLADEIMHTVLSREGGTISAVWCDSGLQAVGSLRAFVARGRTIPPHTGGDLNLTYKLALRCHVPLAAMDYPPAMGLKSVEVVVDMLRGRAVPRRIEVATEMVLTRGAETRSVRHDRWADEHVRWDLPDSLILASGIGPFYDPRSFRIHYRGNRYNRSAADPLASLAP